MTTIIRAGSGTRIGTLEPERFEQLEQPAERLDVVREEARRAGYEEGRELAAEEARRSSKKARAELEERVASAAAILDNAALFVRAQLADELDRVARAAASLALAVTEAVLQREIELAADPGADAIARALRLVPNEGRAVVRLNPTDLKQVGALASPSLELVPDATIGRGGCVLDTGATLIDCRIETAMERVREILERAGAERETVLDAVGEEDDDLDGEALPRRANDTEGGAAGGGAGDE